MPCFLVPAGAGALAAWRPVSAVHLFARRPRLHAGLRRRPCVLCWNALDWLQHWVGPQQAEFVHCGARPASCTAHHTSLVVCSWSLRARPAPNSGGWCWAEPPACLHSMPPSLVAPQCVPHYSTGLQSPCFGEHGQHAYGAAFLRTVWHQVLSVLGLSRHIAAASSGFFRFRRTAPAGARAAATQQRGLPVPDVVSLGAGELRDPCGAHGRQPLRARRCPHASSPRSPRARGWLRIVLPLRQAARGAAANPPALLTC